MVSAINELSDWCFKQLEKTLLPVSSRQDSVLHTAASYAIQVPLFCIASVAAAATATLACLANLIAGQKKEEPSLIAFAKRPVWQENPVKAAPVDIGFATADFQDNGPRVHPDTNWGKDYEQFRPEFLEEKALVPDIWNFPERAIERLLELGVKKYRFSISRDKIEPKPGHFDDLALQHYRDFCRLLIKSGIEPMATLHHFSDPNYFSWERAEDVEGFVRYCEKAAEVLYEEGVRKIVTINEPYVIAFQGWGMGEFPPHHKLDLKGMGFVVENMMRAHVKVYETLKQRHPDLEVGLSHDPIRFRHFHKWNPIWSPAERIFCHYLTELNHNAFMRFLKTGDFSLKIPFLANHEFSVGKKPPLDFIGLQYYSDPLLDFSRPKEEASVTRIPGEKTASYQFRMYPQGLASALEEFRDLNVPIDLTEIGMDIGVNKEENDSERIKYFDRILQVVERALEHNIPVRSLYFWTLIDNLEWYKAWAVRFGFYHFDPATGQITPRGSAEWLKEKIQNRNQRDQSQAASGL